MVWTAWVVRRCRMELMCLICMYAALHMLLKCRDVLRFEFHGFTEIFNRWHKWDIGVFDVNDRRQRIVDRHSIVSDRRQRTVDRHSIVSDRRQRTVDRHSIVSDRRQRTVDRHSIWKYDHGFIIGVSLCLPSLKRGRYVSLTCLRLYFFVSPFLREHNTHREVC